MFSLIVQKKTSWIGEEKWTTLARCWRRGCYGVRLIQMCSKTGMLAELLLTHSHGTVEIRSGLDVGHRVLLHLNFSTSHPTFSMQLLSVVLSQEYTMKISVSEVVCTSAWLLAHLAIQSETGNLEMKCADTYTLITLHRFFCSTMEWRLLLLVCSLKEALCYLALRESLSSKKKR